MHTRYQDKYPLIMTWENKVAVLLMAILVIISLTGCGQVPPIEQITNPQKSKVQETPSKETQIYPNFDGIAHALGCVFAPDKCKKQ